MDVVVTHVNADFDALGGLVGAGRLYPGSVLVLPGGESPGVHGFLSLHREVLSPRVPAEIDTEAIRRIIIVDACSRKRLGLTASWLDLPGVVLDYDSTATDDTYDEILRQLQVPAGARDTIR